VFNINLPITIISIISIRVALRLHLGKKERQFDTACFVNYWYERFCIIILMRIDMNLEEIKNMKQQLYHIAAKHGISKVYVFGSVARGESKEISDIDFLVEMEPGASVFGVGAFQYETQKLLGIQIDVIPAFTLSKVEDKTFVQSVHAEAVAL